MYVMQSHYIEVAQEAIFMEQNMRQGRRKVWKFGGGLVVLWWA